jgi:hypothetical protein
MTVQGTRYGVIRETIEDRGLRRLWTTLPEGYGRPDGSDRRSADRFLREDSVKGAHNLIVKM